MIVVLMVDGELAESLAVKLAPTVGANPGKEFERLFARRPFMLRPIIRCHARLKVNLDDQCVYFTERRGGNPILVRHTNQKRIVAYDLLNDEAKKAV